MGKGSNEKGEVKCNAVFVCVWMWSAAQDREERAVASCEFVAKV